MADKTPDEKLEEKLDMIRSGIKSGKIHTIAIAAVGHGRSEMFAHSSLDDSKLDTFEIGAINHQMCGVLFQMILICQGGTTMNDVDRSANLQVVDEDDPETP